MAPIYWHYQLLTISAVKKKSKFPQKQQATHTQWHWFTDIINCSQYQQSRRNQSFHRNSKQHIPMINTYTHHPFNCHLQSLSHFAGGLRISWTITDCKSCNSTVIQIPATGCHVFIDKGTQHKKTAAAKKMWHFTDIGERSRTVWKAHSSSACSVGYHAWSPVLRTRHITVNILNTNTNYTINTMFILQW